MSQTNDPVEHPESNPPSTKRRRGRWWKVIAAILVLLLLLVLLLPTIASTSPVRNIILGQVNSRVPGKLGVGDWSLGWFSGTTAREVSWTDASGKRIAAIAEVDTTITLSQLIRGDQHFGDIVIRGVQADLVVPVGTQPEAEKPREGAPQPQAKEPTQIPDISARIRVEDISGQVTFVGDDGRSAVIKLDKATRLLAHIPGGGAPATVDALVNIDQPSGASSTTLKATVNGVRPGPLDLKQLSGQGTLQTAHLDLDLVAAILRAMGQDIAVKGILGGEVVLASAGPGQGTAKGEFSASDVQIAMTGDAFQTKTLRIPVDAELTSGASAAAIVRQLGVIIDQGQINVTANVPVKSLDDLQNNRRITQLGSIKVLAQVPDLPVVLNALRHTIKLQEGVLVKGGAFDAQVNIDLAEDGIRIHAPAHLKGLTASRDGKQIGPLQEISIDAAARLPSLNVALADVSDVALQVRSSFMTIDAQGKDIATANAKGQADLGKLRDDFGALVDLSAIRGGKATLDVVNRSATADRLESEVSVQLVDFSYDLKASDTAPARRIDGASVMLTLGSTYEDGKLTVREPLRMQAGGRLLQLQPDRKWTTLLDETLQLTASGNIDTKAKPATAHVAQLELSAGKSPLFRASLAKGKTLDLVFDGKRGVTTDGALSVWADLPAIQSAANRLSAAPAQGGVQRGTFVADLAFAVASDGAVRLAVQNAKSEFTYGAPGAAPYTDNLTADMTIAVPGDNSSAKIIANISSKLARLVLDAQAGLNPSGQGAAMLRTLQVSQLDAQTDFAKVSLAKPLIISDVPAIMAVFSGEALPANAKVSGELLVSADLAKSAAWSTTQPSATHVSGQLSSRQSVSLSGRNILADISSEVADFRFLQDGKAVVEDPKLTFSGTVLVMPANKELRLNKVALTSSTGMLDLKAHMRVSQLGTVNELGGARFEITPDWSKLWPIIFSMLPPERQQKIGELVVTGKGPIVITASGTYPASEGYPSAVKKVVVSGAIPLENADWKTRGIVASGLIPFRLENGVAHFIQGTLDKPIRAKPLSVNGGTVDLSAAKIDITGDIPRLDIPNSTPLAKGVQLNNVLVASLGDYANPLFVNPEKASGSVDLTVAYCRKFPLSTAMYEPGSGGEAQVLIDLHNLDLASKGVDFFLSAISVQPDKGKDRVVGEIKHGVITIADGRVTHKMDLTLGGESFSFDGTMTLSDMSYSALDAGVPRSAVASMMDKWFGVEGATKYLPEQVGLRFTGPASALKLDRSTVDRLVGDVAKQRGSEALSGLLGGGKKGEKEQGGKADNSATKPSQRTPESIGGSLLDMLGGQRDKK